MEAQIILTWNGISRKALTYTPKQSKDLTVESLQVQMHYKPVYI